jgi:hypothetical protein
MGGCSSLIDRARWIADTVLFPDAAHVDATSVIPESHFRILADEGFYGIASPAAAGERHESLDLSTVIGVLEVFAGGCLATTFTWSQHHTVVMGLANSSNAALRETYLKELCSGSKRGGIAFAGALANPPRLRATRAVGGWVFDGEAPMVSAWGIADVLQISGHANDRIVNAMICASAIPGLTARTYDLVVAQATNTVRLKFEGLFVPEEQVVSVVTLPDFFAGLAFGTRLNGCFAIGIALRCATILDALGQTTSIRERASEIRADLDAGLADPATLPSARAAGSALAYRAAGAVVVAEGSAGILRGGNGQRLARDALFALVSGTNAPIKSALLSQLV